MQLQDNAPYRSRLRLDDPGAVPGTRARRHYEQQAGKNKEQSGTPCVRQLWDSARDWPREVVAVLEPVSGPHSRSRRTNELITNPARHGLSLHHDPRLLLLPPTGTDGLLYPK